MGDLFGRYWSVLWNWDGLALLSSYLPKMRFENWEKFTSALKSKEDTHPAFLFIFNGLAVFWIVFSFTFAISETYIFCSKIEV